jgi:hypothetical protein
MRMAEKMLSISEVMACAGIMAYIISMFTPYGMMVLDLGSMDVYYVVNPTFLLLAISACALLVSSLCITVSLIIRNGKKA